MALATTWPPGAAAGAAAAGAAAGVPTWSSYAAACCDSGDEAAQTSGDHALVGYIDHLGGAVRALSEEVRGIEARQVALDRRLAEFGGLLQGFQEEQSTRGGALDGGLRLRVQEDVELQNCIRALLEDWTRRIEQCYQQHDRWLYDLSAQVSALSTGGGRSPGGRSPGGRSGSQGLSPTPRPGRSGGRGAAAADLAAEGGNEAAALAVRVAALEAGQKTIAVGARRALHTALVVHQQQQSQDHEVQWEKCMDTLPFTELEQQFTQRFTEQDERLDKVLQMVDSLTDRFLLQQAVATGRAEPDGSRGLREDFEVMEAKLLAKVEELEAGISGLATELDCLLGSPAAAAGSQRRRPAAAPGDGDGGVSEEVVAAALETLEARVDRGLGEVGGRLESLQDVLDQQRFATRRTCQQLPEVTQKLDQLWAQCQDYFPRVREHEVHLSLLRASFEAHKQSVLDAADNFESSLGRGLGRRALASGGTSSEASRATSPAPRC